MLSLKLAEAFVDLSLQTGSYDTKWGAIQRDLAKFKSPVKILIDADTKAFQAKMASLKAMVDNLTKAAAAVGAGGTGGGGRGAGTGGGGGRGVGGGMSVEDRFLLRDYNRRVAYERRLAAEAARAAQARANAATKAASDLQALQDRYLVRDYNRRLANERRIAEAQKAEAGRTARELQAIQDRYLMAEYRRRVAHERQVADAAKRAAAQAAQTKAVNRQQFVTGIGTGAGLPLAMNPWMLGGQAVGQSMRGTVDAMVEATRVAIDLESKFATLQRVSGLAADKVGGLKQQLFDLATSRGNATSLDDIIEIATIGSRMGVGPDKLGAFTEAMAQVKTVITDLPAEDLANQMSRVLNQFRLGTEYAKGFGSAIVQADNASTASANDILDVMTRLSGKARTAGLQIHETVALAGLLKDAGVSNEVAGTAFGQVLDRMVAKSAAFAKLVGRDVREWENEYRKGPLVALGLVIDKLKAMDDTIASQRALKELGLEGDRVKSTLLQLAAVYDKVGERSAAALAEMQTGKAINDGVESASTKTAAALERLGTAFKRLGDAAAGPYLGKIAAVVNQLTALADAAAKAGVASKAVEGVFSMAIPGGSAINAAGKGAELGARAMRNLPEVSFPFMGGRVQLSIGEFMKRQFGVGAGAAPAAPPGLPALPPRVAPQLAEPKIDVAEFRKAQLAAQKAMMANLQRRFAAAGFQGRFFGGQAQANLGRLGDLARDVIAAPKQGVVGDQLAQLERRRKATMDELARTLPPGQRAEFARVAGLTPTARDRRRPLFAETMQVAHDNEERFARQRAGLMAFGGPGVGRAAQFGLTGSEIGRRIQEDLINGSRKDKDTGKQQVDELKEIKNTLRDVRTALQKGAIGAVGAFLRGPE